MNFCYENNEYLVRQCLLWLLTELVPDSLEDLAADVPGPGHGGVRRQHGEGGLGLEPVHPAVAVVQDSERGVRHVLNI